MLLQSNKFIKKISHSTKTNENAQSVVITSSKTGFIEAPWQWFKEKIIGEMRLNMVGEQDYHSTYGSIIPFMLTVTADIFSIYYAFFLINGVYDGAKVQYKSIEYFIS